MKKGDNLMEIWRFLVHAVVPKIAYSFGIAITSPDSAGYVNTHQYDTIILARYQKIFIQILCISGREDNFCPIL